MQEQSRRRPKPQGRGERGTRSGNEEEDGQGKRAGASGHSHHNRSLAHLHGGREGSPTPTLRWQQSPCRSQHGRREEGRKKGRQEERGRSEEGQKRGERKKKWDRREWEVPEPSQGRPEALGIGGKRGQGQGMDRTDRAAVQEPQAWPSSNQCLAHMHAGRVGVPHPHQQWASELKQIPARQAGGGVEEQEEKRKGGERRKDRAEGQRGRQRAARGGNARAEAEMPKRRGRGKQARDQNTLHFSRACASVQGHHNPFLAHMHGVREGNPTPNLGGCSALADPSVKEQRHRRMRATKWAKKKRGQRKGRE